MREPEDEPEDAPAVSDLTQVSEADHTTSVDIPLCAHEVEALQIEADLRGMTLEDYARGRLVTAAETVLSGGGIPRGGPGPSS